MCWRFAVKEFTAERVPEEKVEALIDAAHLSPSSSNTQPWKLIRVTDPALIAELLPVMMNQSQVRTTKDLFIFCANTDIAGIIAETARVMLADGQDAGHVATYAERVTARFNKMTDDERLVFSQRQLYIALGSFLTAAAMLRVDSGPLEGLDRAGVARVLNLPPNIHPFAAVPIGYRSAEPMRKKVRLPRAAMYEQR